MLLWAEFCQFGLNAISVREKSSIPILQEMTNKPIQVVVDLKRNQEFKTCMSGSYFWVKIVCSPDAQDVFNTENKNSDNLHYFK